MFELRFGVPRMTRSFAGEGEDDFSSYEDFANQASTYLAQAYRFYIADVGAVDTAALFNSVHIEQGTGSMDKAARYVVADVDYASVVEFGWINRGRGQSSYPGRHPAAKAIQDFYEHFDFEGVFKFNFWG